MRFIMRVEGYKRDAYENPKGKWHIGFGHCFDKIDEIPPKIAFKDALIILKNDV
jgi:GH24 family phage-related lysozyme (muramidase)